MRLTDSKVRALPHPEKGQKTYWEQGFGVRVSQGGSKSFVTKVGGRLHTIGRYPAVSLKMARREALALKVAPSSTMTRKALRDVISCFLEDAETRLRPNTIREYRRHLNKAPDVALDKLRRSQIDLSCPEAIKTWKVFYNWCLKEELTERNPFAHLSAVYNSRSRVLTTDELRAVWHYDFPPYSDYLKLQILTGQRIGQWKDYTCSDNVITFPASIMKGKREHTIPLTEATALLLPIPAFNGWSKAKARLDKHVDIPHWTIHDLRRTFSTIMASLQVPLHVTERILAHTSGSISGVAATYNRYNYMIEMREALTRYEDHLHTVIV